MWNLYLFHLIVYSKFRFSVLLLFMLQNSSKLHYFVKIILMYKTCTFNELWLNTELMFCDNPKAYGKILLAFCRGNQFHENSRSAYRVTSQSPHSILKRTKIKSSLRARVFRGPPHSLRILRRQREDRL